MKGGDNMKTIRRKVFNISVIKVKNKVEDGGFTIYNEIKTTPDLGKYQNDLLGHKFDEVINNVVNYLECKSN